VKPVIRQSDKKGAFTIIELLTVMSIIILLMGLFVPALNMVKKIAKRVAQKNQFHSIQVAMEMFNTEWEEYPESEAKPDEITGVFYCGALRLAEGMVGADLLGYDPEGTYDTGDISGRRPYLKPGSANAYKLAGFYSGTRLRPFDAKSYVLCDVYARNVTYNNPGDPMNGRPVGMPILYYRANTSGTTHPVFDPPNGVSVDAETNICKWEDNRPLIGLGKPWEVAPPAPESRHSLLDPTVFYQKTWDYKIDIDAGRPYNADAYILVSAGFDGEYGTDDDVFNFGM
jgi:type II secretory pathway pseudopilin PulG